VTNETTLNERGPILLFDGACNFCNGAVNFIIDRDRDAKFRFASLQSEAGKALLHEHGLSDLPLSTLVLIDEGRAYLRSDGVLRAAQRLGGPWALLTPLLLLPRALRDPLYVAFARSRYRLFGESTQCRVPTPEIRARFLDLQ
jgi:predicted DCC family thiol-disulfide oxidoreductase YuxK